MATGAMVVSWGTGIPGREAKGLEVFGSALEWAEAQAKAGRIHGHKEYFCLDEERGFQILEGEVSTLRSLMDDEEFRTIMVKAAAIVHDFRVSLYEGGSDAAIQAGMGRYMTALQELGYWA